MGAGAFVHQAALMWSYLTSQNKGASSKLLRLFPFSPSSGCMCPVCNAHTNTDVAAGDRGRRPGRAASLAKRPNGSGAALPTPHSPLPTPNSPLPPPPPHSHSPLPPPAPPRPAPLARCLPRRCPPPAISRDYANDTAPPRPASPAPPPRALPGRVSARGRGALWDSGGIKCTLGAAVAEGAGASGA